MAMIRTQISLDQGTRKVLDEQVQLTGRSMAALIRDAVEQAYGKPYDPQAALAALEAGLGAWKDRDFTGEEYVERMRDGRRRYRTLYGEDPPEMAA